MLIEVKATKNHYFKAIHTAKQNYWNEFVKIAHSRELWSLYRLSKLKDTDTLQSFPNASTAEQLNNVLISHFFPPLYSPPTPPPNPVSRRPQYFTLGNYKDSQQML
jgi:hypothetical protein